MCTENETGPITNTKRKCNYADRATRDRELSFALLNCRSIRSETKAREFQLFVREHGPDVIMGTESWLSNDINDAEIFPPNYVTYRKDRCDRTGGGVFISIRDNISSYKEDWNSADECEAIWCRIIDKYKKHYTIGCFYDPPSDSELRLSEFLSVLEEKALSQNSKIIVGGDFNLPDIDWENILSVVGGRNRNKSDLLVNVINSCGMEQMVKVPTRVTEHASNILDLILTNVPQIVNNVTTCSGISDHLAVTFQTQDVSRQPKVKRKIKQYSRANFDDINQCLYQYFIQFRENASSRTVDENWIKFKEAISNVERLIPTRTFTVNGDPPWYSLRLKRLEDKQRRFHRKAKLDKSAASLQRYREMRAVVKQAYKDAESNYKSKLGSLLKEDSRHFWKYVKAKRSKTSGISSIVSASGDIVHNPEDIANILNNQYRKIFCEQDKSETPLVTDYSRTSDTMLPVHIDYHGIVGLLKKINVKKACGPDGICGAILKHCAKVVAMFLKCIFDQSLDTGDIPHDWRQAIVHPVFKGGSAKQPENYRPISLTCICCKMMERILVSYIVTHLEDFDLFSHNQHGFRRNLSCESQLILLYHDVMSSIDKKKSVDLAFIDFSKAFDKVPHNHLLNKLKTYNLDQNVLRWIKAFLSNRTQRVMVNNYYSNEIRVTSGVPQGSVLGPILFLLYINDLPDTIDCQIKLYADDVVLYADVRSNEDVSCSLQTNILMLSQWCSKWKMSVNVRKCAIMRVTRQTDAVTPKYYLNDIAVPVVNEFKYLGVHISNKCTWQNHVQHVTGKANQMLRFIKRNFRDCPQTVKEIMYLSLVRPHLDYASCVWDPWGEGMKHELEMVQRRAARFVLNDYGRQSSVTDMLSTIGWEPLESRRREARLCFLYKLYHGYIKVDVSNIIREPSYIARSDHSKKNNAAPVEITPISQFLFSKNHT